MTSDHSHDDDFTQAARRAHAASLNALSPRVRAQLAQRRRAALGEHGQTTAPRRWPTLALGSAAALTLVIGLFLLRSPGETGTSAQGAIAATPAGVAPPLAPTHTAAATPPIAAADPASSVAGTNAVTNALEQAVENIVIDDSLSPDLLAAEFAAADDVMGFDALEESPDFYLWLGADSAPADAPELL